MILANPIYDVVFKYLMEDTEIARRLLSKITGEEDYELLRMIAERLRKAATEEELLRKIEIEEEVENTIEQHIREKQELTDRNNKLRNTISEKEKTISEKDKLIEELKRQIDEKKKGK